MKKYTAYTDGSFITEKSSSPNKGRAGWGFTVQNIKGETVHESYGLTNFMAPSRNIDGEVQAAIEAIKWAIKREVKILKIVTDYKGVQLWGDGTWNPSSKVAFRYMKFLNSISGQIKLEFVWIKGHQELQDYMIKGERTRILGNRKADELATKAKEII
jgi:ribonuclease HI